MSPLSSLAGAGAGGAFAGVGGPAKAANGKHACSDDCATQPPAPIDDMRTSDASMRNQGAVDDRFLDFYRALEPRLEIMRLLRPSLMEQPFDVVYDDGRLKAVDTSMTTEDRTWLEEELNRDGHIARLADAFNRQVARTYDEDHGIWDLDGNFHGNRPLYAGLNGSISYNGLNRTVDGSMKLMSLYNDVMNAELPWTLPENFRHRVTTEFVQNYIQGEISTYVRLPDGRLELQTVRGTAQYEYAWI
ncbi:MAG: hypothetical protein ABWZ85_03915 [Luteibacter sp.]|jgi:hypothetical protein